jgi:hypothetical protein
VGTVERLQHRHPLSLPSKPAFDMLVVVMKIDADGRRRSRRAQLPIAGLVGKGGSYFPVSPDLLLDMDMA